MPADPGSVARLIEDLQADDASVRRLARDRLAAIGPAAVPALMAALADAPEAYRLRLGVAYALNAMLRARPEAASEVARQLTDADIDRLVAAVGDPDKTVRLYVTEFLYQLGDPRSIPAGLRVVEGRDARVAPAEQSNAAYNSLLVIKSASGQLPAEAKAEIAASIDKAVPVAAPRTRSLADRIIEESGEPSP
jgi:HEAT repeat protein